MSYRPASSCELPGLPAEALLDLGRQRVDVHVGQLPAATGGPRRAGPRLGLAVDLGPPRRLHIPRPQPRRRGEVHRRQRLLGVPEELLPAAGGAAHRLAERVGERLQGGDLEVGRRLTERVVGPAGDQRGGVLRRWPGGGLGLGLGHELGDVVGGHTAAADHPGGDAVAAVVGRDHRHGPAAAEPVGGQRVRGPAQVGRGVGLDQDDARTARGLEGALGQDVRGGLAHARPSSVVFRIRTFRKVADGQPWLTAATWPGWPLPQLKAPPRT